MRTRLGILVAVLTLVAAACGGTAEAQNCDDISTETVDLIQELIDDVDAEFGDMSIEEFLANGEDLPSLQAFREHAEVIDKRAGELGCTQTEIAAGVIAQSERLAAKTRLGDFVIQLLTDGS
jgi:hypothetical protein